MTFNYKAFSLLLLTSLAMGSVSARTFRSNCDCDKKERNFCKVTCCDKSICKKECKPEASNLAFDCCLSFEQVIDEFGNARPEGDKVPGLCGRFQICFAKDFSKAEYKLTIIGEDLLTGNSRLLGAFLYCGTPTTRPSIPLKDQNIVALAGLTNTGEDSCDLPEKLTCLIGPKEFCCKDTITNADLAGNDPLINIKTVAALYQAIREGIVFVSINGCQGEPTAIKYEFEERGGMLRCQLLGEEVAGKLNKD